jgi:DNA polymerase
MTSLDNRQLEILGKMGIDVWRLRSPSTVKTGNEVAENPVPDYTTESSLPGESLDVAGSVNTATADHEAAGSTLDEIAVEISNCQRCQLHETRINTVPGVGMSPANWMFIGEAPGQNEDQQGLPFVGRAGQLLDAMIAALRMQRSDVFIANTLKCRPPGNRDPLPAEVTECEPFLHRQLAVVKPAVIVALGRISAQLLLKSSEPLGKLRGRVHQYGNTGIPLVATYHPAYLLRNPQQKSRAWKDLLLAQSIVKPDS